MAESDFNIDDAEAQYNAARAAEDEGTPPLPDVEELDADGNPIESEDPPGFKTYEDYVADGGDPDMYRGRKAYEAEHNRIDENKTLKRELKGLKSTVQQTMDAVNSWQETERGKIRTEVEAELHEAMENEDPKAAVAAQKKLDAIDDTPDPAPNQREENPVIQDFRAANPILDGDSDNFDQEFNADVEAFYNGMYAQLSYNGKREITDGQIKRCLRRALKEAQDLHEIEPEPRGRADDNPRGESPRNQRRGNPRSQRRAQQTPRTAKAEDFTIENPRNPRQKNAAPEVRDMIHQKALNQALKSGKSEKDAKAYADGEAKRFEESLAS